MAFVRVENVNRDQATFQTAKRNTEVRAVHAAKLEGAQAIRDALVQAVWSKGGASFVRRLTGYAMTDGRLARTSARSSGCP